jgi:hypothetical protein
MSAPEFADAPASAAAPSGAPAPKSGTAFLAAGLAVVATGFALRFWDLARQPIWKDEAYSYVAAQLPLKTILFGEIDDHPPLFYALQHLWYGVDTNVDALRVPAAILGGLAVVAVALAAADLVSPAAGVFAGAFLALSTSHVYFSQDARMYTLLTLGVAVALWGLGGLATRPERRLRYAAFYVFGGALAVYAQVVSLVFLAMANLPLLGLLAMHRAQRKALFWLIGANLALAVVSAPWLMSLLSVMGGFTGLRPQPASAGLWFWSTDIGYPGAPGWAKKPALLLLLAVMAYGAWRARRAENAPLVTAALATVFLYPLALIALNTRMPILEHRVFTPCAVGAALLFGFAVAEISRPGLRYLVLLTLLALAAVSLVTEHRLRVKPEDDVQAFALIDQAGYRGAPILTCDFSPALTAHLTAPGRPVFFITPEGPVRMDKRFPRALAMSVKPLRSAGAPQFARYLGDAADTRATSAIFQQADRAVLLDAGCDASTRSAAFLRRLGFSEAAAPAVKQPDRVMFHAIWTKVELWRKPPLQAVTDQGARRPGRRKSSSRA